MKSSSPYWADLSSHDFAQLRASGAAARSIAVLPVAATEQHGPHLPLSVDTQIVNAIIQGALAHLADTLSVLVLPTQAVGLSPEHMRFAGTLTLKAETILHLWGDIAESVARAGLSKLLIFNSHGGNVSVMDMLARDLRARLNLLVYSVSWFNLPLLDDAGQDVMSQFSADEQRFGIHGGAIETSMMLALDAPHVVMARAQNFRSSAQRRASEFAILGNGHSAKLAWQMQDYNPLGAVGNAAAGHADKGHALISASARALARLLGEIDRLPADTLQAQAQPCQAQ